MGRACVSASVFSAIGGMLAMAALGCAAGGDPRRGDGSREDGGRFERDAPLLDDAPGRDAPVPDVPLSCSGGETACPGGCAGLMTDALNCGSCGRTCVVPSARAACVAGECAIGACDPGRLDCNAMADDGCEMADTCTAGSCTTSCMSEGVRSCADRCAPVCTPPAETCNYRDDDCDGSCESGLAGCRRSVHRSYGTSHFYTTDRTEAACCGMTVEAYDFYYLYTGPADGLQPFFRCITGTGYHFYTTDTACDMRGGMEGQMGFIGMGAGCGGVPLYRLELPAGDFFYTHAASERDYAVTLGYAYIGISGYVWTSP